jgi:hypothetical protein
MATSDVPSEELEQRAQGHARVGAGADDVVGVVQHRAVEHERCWDRGDEGDDEEHACNRRDRSTFPFSLGVLGLMYTWPIPRSSTTEN